MSHPKKYISFLVAAVVVVYLVLAGRNPPTDPNYSPAHRDSSAVSLAQVKPSESPPSAVHQAAAPLPSASEKNLKKLQAITINYLDSDCKLSPGVSEILELSPMQVNAINNSFQTALNEMVALESMHAKLEDDAAGNEIIEISAFPKEGAGVLQTLQASLSSAIGCQTSELILSKIDRVRRLGDFGAKPRQIYIEGTTPNLMLHDYELNEDGSQGSGHAEQINPYNIARIKIRYGHILRSL